MRKLLVFIFPLLLSLPFINRAYFVDDQYFVQIADWLKDNPSMPYHFIADDAGLDNRGWEENGFVRMVNPLGHHYFLAMLLKMGGEREWFLRLGCVLLSCFAGLFIFGLARRWTAYPLLATLLVLVTPAFWLSSHSLLIDSTTGFLFVGALYVFVRALEGDNLMLAVVSGILMGLAVLTKYTALLIVPLTMLWWGLRYKSLHRPFVFLWAWVLPLLFLGAYSVITWKIYGAPHIWAASERMMAAGDAAKLAFFVFFTGVTILPILSWGVNGKWVNLIMAVGGCALAGFLSSERGGFSDLQAGMFSFWMMTTFSFFAALLTTYFKWGWAFPKDYFLVGWVLGFVVMMSFVMPWVGARYFIIVLPAVVFLCVRMVERRWPKRAKQILVVMLGVVLSVGGALAYADYKQAETNRRLIKDLRIYDHGGGPRHFFLGDSFTMSYMKEEGWTPCFPDTRFQIGDLVLGRTVTMPLIWFKNCPINMEVVQVFDYPTWFPVKVMDYRGGAGFYASVWGVLPFSISIGPWERYYLVRVTGLREPVNIDTIPAR